jgi:predicted dehydrogenase/threonine dehydrogenase-like Zn-dependent dehydrogenase
MKQVVQSLSDGSTTVAEVATPAAAAGRVLVRTSVSLLSAGTERMLVQFGRAGMLAKARQQPEKVRQVWDKVQTDGVLATAEALRSKLDEPLALGYCNVGVVQEAGAGVTGIAVGTRVASNGPHAEIVSVSPNLCAAVPDSVSDEAASFTVLGAIALQGIRLASPTLGETFVVTGLGLIGLMAVQLLRANGCRVLGIDPDPWKAEMARSLGAEIVPAASVGDPIGMANAFARGRGVDGVIITASTRSNDPVTQAARMCRKRGRIVLVGVTGLELNRSDFYEKELSFQVSCSYGPGRYDPEYEEKGHDYPLGFVRWTEQRNFEAVLDMMASGQLNVTPLITHRIPFDEAPRAYELLSTGSEPYLGIVMNYAPERVDASRTVRLAPAPRAPLAAGAPTVAVIGAGNYAGRVLIPAWKSAGARLHTIVNNGGVSGTHYGRKYGFELATTDSRSVFANPEIDTAVIATRHDSHAQYVCAAFEAGKHVFVEKPLALTDEELDRIERAYALSGNGQRLLMVGFNRRFSPLVQKAAQLLESVVEPKSFVITVNAGAIPANHWTQDPRLGGGRLVGEGCHFIDLMRHLAASPIVSWTVQTIGDSAGSGVRDDKAAITLGFEDGSFGTIHYLANGHASFPKERVEVFAVGRVLQIDNFRTLRGFGWGSFSKMSLWRQDKGQQACAQAVVDAIRTGGPAPIPFEELMEVSRVTAAVGRAARA